MMDDVIDRDDWWSQGRCPICGHRLEWHGDGRVLCVPCLVQFCIECGGIVDGPLMDEETKDKCFCGDPGVGERMPDDVRPKPPSVGSTLGGIEDARRYLGGKGRPWIG